MLMTVLLALIYLAFVSMGLPDSLLGSTWPAMYGQAGTPVSCAGVLSMLISMGTICSSLMSGRLIRRLGTGCVTAASVCLTAAALLGFSFGTRFGAFCFWAVWLGLGAGGVDAALNNFVALHYRARHMNWLHCFWGVGATAGPVILSFWLSRGQSWAMGYRTVGAIQLVLGGILTLSLPLWRRAERAGEAQEHERKTQEYVKTVQTHAEEGQGQAGEPWERTGTLPVPVATAQEHAETAQPHAGTPRRAALLALPGVRAVLTAFFCYHAAEMTIGLWSSSYLVLCRGRTAAEAAGLLSLYYIGITAGRLAAGFLAGRWEERRLIRIGEGIVLAGVALAVTGSGGCWMQAAFLMMGAGCAPIYPGLLHETPRHFGAEHCQAMMGIQMAAAYTGATCMPLLFGVLGSLLGYRLFPLYVAALLGLTVWMVEKVSRSTGA